MTFSPRKKISFFVGFSVAASFSFLPQAERQKATICWFILASVCLVSLASNTSKLTIRKRPHAALPLESPTRLSPQSPGPEVERMFFTRGRGGSGWSPSNSNRSARLREIDEEEAAAVQETEEDGDGGGKLYVAVGKDLKDGRSNLLWAARNLLAGDPKLVLLHVHQPADRIMSGLCKVSASQLEEKELKAYRTIEKEEMNTLLNQYLHFCRVSLKVQAETLVIEKNNIASGIVELIDQHHIKKLAMGASSVSMKKKAPKSKVAATVHLQAKPYCHLFYISKETLACSREANQLSAKVASPQRSCTSSVTDQPELHLRSLSLPPGHPGLSSSTDQQALQRRCNSVTYPLSVLIADSVENMSATRPESIDRTSTGFSPYSSQQSIGGSSWGLKGLDSIDGSPPPVSTASSEEHQLCMVETVRQNEVFEQVHRVRNELERSRKEASEGRQKAERDLFEASMMFKARENSLHKEKKEVEERLNREKMSLEKEHIHICNELQKANEQRAELENKLLQANSLMEELKQLQVVLQREKDHVVRQAEEMRQINGKNVFGSTCAVALTEFSYEEIKEATNDFDDSKKIGQGGCGSVYKGLLRHTTVAIKKFNREDAAGEKEFNDEVETLCRMRHPNLVTLIGVCREAKALVFEFLSNGSLEDRLQCKHQTEPLSWRTRLRIAADICTGLIFLHSNKPKGIAHGDLKPDNVLLDTSFVCKLADFGISRPLNLTNTTVTPYHRTDQIKGTMGYMDPGYIATGELTAQYDVYSFGVVLLRLLTGKSPLGLPNEVEAALSNDMLQDIIDTSAGEWPPEYAEELARLAVICCRYDRKERPDLAKEVWGVLQAMMNCSDDKCQPPPFFICPITQEIMRDPHIAFDGFTYEGEAIKDWLQRGNETSPTTYLSFTHHELIPNSALRFAIQEWYSSFQLCRRASTLSGPLAFCGRDFLQRGFYRLLLRFLSYQVVACFHLPFLFMPFQCLIRFQIAILFVFLSLSSGSNKRVSLGSVYVFFVTGLFTFVHRMFTVYYSAVHLLETVASRCRLPSHSYLREVGGDGSVLGGVELEIATCQEGVGTTRFFFWACMSAGARCPYEESASQAIRFLQGLYGFVVHDFGHEGMLAYREVARSAIFLALSLSRPGSSVACDSSSIDDPTARARWQMLCNQLLSSIRNI